MSFRGPYAPAVCAWVVVLGLAGCGGGGSSTAHTSSNPLALTPAEQKVSIVKNLATPKETVAGNSVSFLQCMLAGYKKHGIDPTSGKVGSPALDQQLVLQCTEQASP